jgi:hypothetical protein
MALVETFDPDAWVPDAEPTLCVTCDHVHPDTLAKPPFSWRCLKFPAPPFGGFVDPNWRPDPPYHKCQDRNDGACPFWKAKRTANV